MGYPSCRCRPHRLSVPDHRRVPGDLRSAERRGLETTAVKILEKHTAPYDGSTGLKQLITCCNFNNIFMHILFYIMNANLIVKMRVMGKAKDAADHGDNRRKGSDMLRMMFTAVVWRPSPNEAENPRGSMNAGRQAAFPPAVEGTVAHAASPLVLVAKQRSWGSGALSYVSAKRRFKRAGISPREFIPSFQGGDEARAIPGSRRQLEPWCFLASEHHLPSIAVGR